VSEATSWFITSANADADADADVDDKQRDEMRKVEQKAGMRIRPAKQMQLAGIMEPDDEISYRLT